MSRANALLGGLALLLAISATIFGAVAVSAEHHAEHGSGHSEHAAHSAEHAEQENVLDVRDGLAALALSLFAIALVPIGIRAGSRPADGGGGLRFTAAAASAGAATIHFAVIDQHFEEWWLFGVFFVAVAVAQLVWMLAVVSRPTRGVYVVGVLGNALVAVTWVVSRTTGVPLGPEAGEPESVGIADTVSTAFEVGLVILTLLLLRGLEVPRRSDTRVVRLMVAIAAVALTTLALAQLAGL
jgi:hypothetical protein